MKDRLIKKFEDEIQALDRELKLELPKEIKRARELGDLRENAEYQAAKERQRLVESRISMLKKRVSEIAPHQRRSHSHGSRRLRLDAARHREHGEKMVFQLVMPEDADAAKGLISTTSPIGARLPEQGSGRQRQGDDAGRRARVRNHQAATIHDEVTDGPAVRRHLVGRRPLLPATSHRARADRHRHRRRLPRRRAARAARSRRQDRCRGRAGHRCRSAPCFAAVDGAQRLWDEKGFWRAPAGRALYPWRSPCGCRVGPAFASAGDCGRADHGRGGRADRVSDRFPPADGRRRRGRRGWSARTFASCRPRSLRRRCRPGCRGWCFLVLGALRPASVRRRLRGAHGGGARAVQRGGGSFRAPLSRTTPCGHCWRALWDLVRGAAQLQQPAPGDWRRYAELLAENLGQPASVSS